AQQERARQQQKAMEDVVKGLTDILNTVTAAKAAKGTSSTEKYGGLGAGKVIPKSGGQKTNVCPPGEVWVDNGVFGQGDAGCQKAPSNTGSSTTGANPPPLSSFSCNCCCVDERGFRYSMLFNLKCNDPRKEMRRYCDSPSKAR
ncbi:MAG: hypothetical protein JXO72_09635, partial [Vicinamibacteria bacterium]|nr:hypothetical protein [Vicinamibacteria bacterium]